MFFICVSSYSVWTDCLFFFFQYCNLWSISTFIYAFVAASIVYLGKSFKPLLISFFYSFFIISKIKNNETLILLAEIEPPSRLDFDTVSKNWTYLEARFLDPTCIYSCTWNLYSLLYFWSSQKIKFFLWKTGAYDSEEAAARTYDLAALKYWGPETILNFPVLIY